MNRLSILLLGIVAISLVINEEIRVYKYVLTYGWAILGAAFAPQLILALFWSRASRLGCFAGMAMGFVAAVLWPQIYDSSTARIEIYNLPLAFALALLTNIAASRLWPDSISDSC